MQLLILTLIVLLRIFPDISSAQFASSNLTSDILQELKVQTIIVSGNKTIRFNATEDLTGISGLRWCFEASPAESKEYFETENKSVLIFKSSQWSCDNSTEDRNLLYLNENDQGCNAGTLHPISSELRPNERASAIWINIVKNISCPESMSIQNGQVSSNTIEKNVYENENHTVTYAAYHYTCDPGYIRSGRETIYCVSGIETDEQLLRTGDFPSCTRPQCPHLEDPLNGAINQTTNETGQTVTYSCNPGHILSGNKERTCFLNKDGIAQWTGTLVKCIPNDTSVLVTPSVGTSMTPNIGSAQTQLNITLPTVLGVVIGALVLTLLLTWIGIFFCSKRGKSTQNDSSAVLTQVNAVSINQAQDDKETATLIHNREVQRDQQSINQSVELEIKQDASDNVVENPTTEVTLVTPQEGEQSTNLSAELQTKQQDAVDNVLENPAAEVPPGHLQSDDETGHENTTPPTTPVKLSQDCQS